MADLTYQVDLNTREAQRQIDALEQQLNQLSQPIDVPVDVGNGGDDLARIRRELGLADDSVENLNRELDETDDSLRRAGSQASRTGADIETAGRRGSTAFGGLGRSVLGFVTALGAIQGARAFLNFAGDAIDAASDLEESTSKAQVVFGDFFSDIEDFASTAPQALGLANAEALEFAGTFGNLFVALGLTQDAAADLAPEIVQLGSDLASFNNLEVTDALDKLRAGLVGEAEPLRALGVNLTAASTAAKAVELGLAASTSEVSEAAKVQARYALILEQTTTAQGDFARTADGIANQQRTLAGEFENLRASVGEALLPAFQLLLDAAPAIIGAVEGLIPAVEDLAAGFANNTEDVVGFINALADIPNVIGGVGDVGGGLLDALPNFAGAVRDLVTLNPTGFFSNIKEGLEDVNDAATSLDLRRIREDVLDAVQGGEDELVTLANAVAALGNTDASLEQFTDEAERLFAVLSVDASRAPDLFRALSDGADLTIEELEIVRRLIDDIIGGSVDIGPNFARQGRGARQLADDTDAAAASVRQIGDDLQQLEPLDTSAFEASQERLEDLFGALPSALGDAAEALRDEENEIITDVDVFLQNLQDEIAESVEFSRLIGILEARGQGALADFYLEEGETAIEALQNAVANPAVAEQINRELETQAQGNASAYRQAFVAELESQDLSFEARVNLIVTEFGLAGQIRDGGQLDIPDLGGTGGQGGGTNDVTQSGGGSGGGGVTIYNYAPTLPTTQMALLAHEINAIQPN